MDDRTARPSEDEMAMQADMRTVISRLAAEHDTLSDLEVDLRQIRFHVERKEGMPDLKPVIDFLQVDLLKHFELEERFVFPAALLVLQDVEVARTVLGLQEVHGRIRCQAEYLVQAMTDPKLDRSRLKGEILDRLDSLSRQLQDHAKTEGKRLFPKLNACPKVHEMIRVLLKTAA